MSSALITEVDTPQAELLQICRRVVRSEMSPDAAFALIKNMKKTNPSTSSLLEDVLWLIDMEMAIEKKNDDSTKKFNELLSLISNEIVPEDVLKFELDALGANDTTVRSRIVKMKTKLYFKQLKFNLLREESEGYAKLITELLDSNNECVASTLIRLHRLIGQFNLDPNRVLDIILECFELSTNRRQFFISLLNDFKTNTDDLCSILGFKFTFYQQNGDTPPSLYELAAILCSERVIDLISLCSFLSPTQESIISENKARIQRDQRRSKRAEMVSTGAIPIELNHHHHPQSLLSSTSSPYIDDSMNANIAGVSFATVSAQQEAEDVKLLDAIESEETILSKNQQLGLTYALLEQGAWVFAKQLLDRFPEFYAVNASKRIALSIAEMIERSIDDFYQEKCKIGLGQPKTPSLNATTHSLEIVGSWSELISVVLPVLWYLGPYIAYRASATVKLVRLISVFFEEKAKDTETSDSSHSESVANALIDVIDEVLMPSVSLFEMNYAISDEIWHLLSHFPYTLRYRIYAHWKGVMTQRHSLINVQRGKTLGMTRYVVKRLSKETVRMMGRQLGKLCHSHPTVVFDCLLNQIQTFENLIEPVVESIRFLSDLEFDVLSFCIIEHLASPDKQQLKASDGSLSPWLQSLATFVGTVFLKYNMELTGILQYVANQLRNGKSFDLLILREIIQNMSGIEPTTGLTSDQLEALSGGQTLRQEAGSFSQVRSNRRAMQRLRDSLAKDNLVEGLSILIAQQRNCIVFIESNDIPLKLAAKMLDQCQETLVQFGSFLRSNLRQDEYSDRIMSIDELISKYYLPTDAAFFLCRPSYLHRIYSNFDKCRRALRDADGNKTKLDTNRKFALFKSAFDEELSNIEKKLMPLMPETLWADISSKVFIIFWTLTMYDISVPKAAYEKEIQRVRRSLATLADNVEISKTKRAKEEEQLKGVEKKLSDELKKQNDHVERILAILRHDKELLFADCAPNMRGMQMARFLQYCILPRAVFTDIDAVYCAHFVHLLHQQRTGFFQTVFFFDKLFNDIAIILTAFTENEANCFGRFLSLMLEIVQRWHGDKNVFEKECHGFPGFMTKLHTRNAEGITESHNGGMNFESYRSLCHKWQFRMARSSVAIMNGGNYVLMRNCLIVMTKVLQYFPLIESHVGSIQKVVMKVRDSEKGNRDDLSLMAASYASHLQMRKTSVFTEAQFHNRSALTAKKTTTQKVTVSKASSNEVANNPKAQQQQQQSESVAKKVTVKGTESSDSKKANDSEASGKRDGGTEAADAASTKQRTTTSVNGELAVKSSIVNSSSANRNTTTTASKSSSSSDHGKSSASQISSNDPKNDAISSKSVTASTNADERKRASTTNVTVKNDSPAHKKNKVSSNSTEVTVSSKNSSSKNVETRHSRESNSQTNKTASKEEQKMEEGEVCASPPSSSSTHHTDSGHTSKKVRSSKVVDDEVVSSHREKDRSKHDEKKDERRKQQRNENIAPSAVSKSKQTPSEDQHISKTREKSWKRPGDTNDVNVESSTKVARREKTSPTERTPESRGFKTPDLSPATNRSSSRRRRSREPPRSQESSRSRERSK